MTVTDIERVRALMNDVDFPEPRHDVRHTVRIGRRRRAGRWAATATMGVVVLAGVAAVVRVAPWAGTSGPDGTTAGPVQVGDCRIEHLALPAGVGSAIATGVDPTGRRIIGDADNRTILWTDGQPTLLPAEAVGAEAVNSSGTVVGTVMTGGGNHAWVYREGRVSRLPVPSGGAAEQVSINEAGDIAGTLSRTSPIVWPADRPGTYTVLDAPAASVVSVIGDNGVMVGYVEGVGPYRWDTDGSGRPLALLPGVATGSAVDLAGNWATGLLEWSTSEPVAGFSIPPGGLAAVRWNLTTGEVTSAGVDGRPAGIDAAGRILMPESPPRLIGLDNVVLPLPPDRAFHRTVARGMTDTGIVVGAAATDDKDPNAGPYRSQPLRWIC
jgi:hypothetical protein